MAFLQKHICCFCCTVTQVLLWKHFGDFKSSIWCITSLKVGLACRCCGSPSLKHVYVLKPRGEWATVLNHFESGQSFHGQWSLEGAVQKKRKESYFIPFPHRISLDSTTPTFSNLPKANLKLMLPDNSYCCFLWYTVHQVSTHEKTKTWALYFLFEYFYKKYFSICLFIHAFELYAQWHRLERSA